MQTLDRLFLIISDAISSILTSFLPGWAVALIMTVIGASVVTLLAVVTMMYLTLMERKVVGRIQDRIGPNRVGPLGMLQPFADMIKMFTKEDLTPRVAHRLVYNLAPIFVVPPALMVLAVIPFGRGLIGTDLNIGFLYVIALASTSTISVFMAGWGSRNKYALLGAMRAAAQIVSYEIPQVLSVVGVLILAGSLSMGAIVEAQRSLWFILLQPIGFVIFIMASVAEINRAPFDIPEAESEIIAGHHIEYSGMKFAMFFLAEYVSVFAVSAIATTLFLGGWRGPILPSWLWFFIKTFLVVFFVMWLRGTLPRLRVDQLMNFAWKVLVPLSLVNLLFAGLASSLVVGQGTPVLFVVFLVANLIIVAGVFLALRRRATGKERVLEPSGA